MFSDERTLTLVKGVSKMVHHPCATLRYNPKFTVKNVRHPSSVTVWEISSKNYAGQVYTLVLKM